MAEKQKFDPDGSFTVRESRATNYALAIIFLVIFISSVYTADFSAFSAGSPSTVGLIAIVPAVLFFIKAGKHKLIMEVNASGFFYQGKLITDWQNFISVKFTEEEKAFRISDNFFLLIEYFKPGEPTSFVTKIGLGNTQDKSEEEIIEAVEFYHGRSGFHALIAEE